MAKQAVYDYSTTASSNSDFDGTDSSGATGKVKDGDNYARSIASHIKGFANDLGGINTVAGTGDAITITLSAAPSALVDGMRLTFNASAANTTNVTLNVTPAGGAAFGSKKVLKWAAGVETALSANDIPAANALIELIYDTARDTAAGAWMLLGTSVAAATTSASGIVQLATLTEAATLTNATKAVTPSDLTFLGGYATTATAAGTTTLTVTDVYSQYFTGTSTQTVVLPVTSTLVLGRSFRIVNNSTGAVTVQSSGANTIKVMGGTGITLAPGAPGTELIVTCILTSGTGTASWDYEYRTPITDWVAYTPTFTGFGTVTGISFFARRVGDSLEVQGKFTTGTPTATEARVTLGFAGTSANVTADSVKVASVRNCGEWSLSRAGAFSTQVLMEGAVSYMTFGQQDGSNGGGNKINGSGMANASDTISLFARFPIQGW